MYNVIYFIFGEVEKLFFCSKELDSYYIGWVVLENIDWFRDNVGVLKVNFIVSVSSC